MLARKITLTSTGYDPARGREVRDPTLEGPVRWRFGQNGLTVDPDITWEEWTVCWEAAAGLHRRSMFYIGDALNSGELLFGEKYTQVVGDYSVETIRTAMWVAKRIPAYRRHQVSFSQHRAVAALEPEDQDALLEQAEANGWTTADMRAAIKALKDGREPTGHGGPRVITQVPLAAPDRPQPRDVGTTTALMRERAEIKEILADWWLRWTASRRADGFDGDPGTGLVQIDDWARDLPEPRDCAAAT